MKNNKMKDEKECLHDFHSVYYGSEWAVECRKCEKDVGVIYNKEDADRVVDIMLETNRTTK